MPDKRIDGCGESVFTCYCESNIFIFSFKVAMGNRFEIISLPLDDGLIS